MIFRMTTIFCLLFFVLVSGTQVRFAHAQKEIWLVKSASSLQVDGKTNVNQFTCHILSYGRLDTLTCETTKSVDAVKVKSRIAIAVNKFDCGMKMMTKDLQKTLKQEEYPFLFIEFRQFSKMLSESKGVTTLSGVADISLAGTTQKYQIQCSSKRLNETEMVLSGSKIIKLTDFHLKPPSKLGGAIRVEDQMVVHFVLQLKRISYVQGTF